MYVYTMEKISLKKDYKIALYAALIAFFLSILIGLISSNPTAVVFVRAFISALLFGAVLYGGLYLLRRFIPELEGGTDREKVREKTGHVQADVGKTIDLSVSGEDTGGVTIPEAAIQEALASAPQDTAVRVPAVEKTAYGAERAEVSLEQKTGVPPEKGTAVTEEGLPPVPEMPGVSSANGLEGINLEPPESTGSELGEELPSLDRLYEDHEEEAVSEIRSSVGVSRSSAPAPGKYIEVGNARIPYEPEILAKAVKKVMKQDEQ